MTGVEWKRQLWKEAERERWQGTTATTSPGTCHRKPNPGLVRRDLCMREDYYKGGKVLLK